jgi:thioredoxin-like negative regulator of GroEL
MPRFRPGPATILAIALAAAPMFPARCSDIQWQKSYVEAMQLAKRQKKPVLLQFYAEWCSPCKAMSATTLKSNDVVKLSRRFIAVRIDVDKAQELADRFQVGTIPYAAVVAPDGKLVRASRGYLDAPTYCLFLKQSLPE